jgi:hypothetical protein
MSIFVSVASYRDPELVPTLQDCVRKARHPADLHFGVCWQHDPDEPPLPDLSPARISLIRLPWQDSGGACWARAQVMSLWNGEDFFLQIDSHHRFVQDWDALLLDQLERSGAERPLLSTLPADFDPALPMPTQAAPTAMGLAQFTREGIPVYLSLPRPDWDPKQPPVRTRFLAAGLVFTLGRFVQDVPYDPALYFLGEEITLAIRAFTHGYSLFHPSVHVLWHQYNRQRRVMHWDDHRVARGRGPSGKERDHASLMRVRQFLREPHVGAYGCGLARRFEEYEAYAGLNFLRRSASPAARKGEEPAPPPSLISGTGGVRTWPLKLVLERARLPAAALDQPAFWYVAFHDRDGNQVARQDAQRDELHALLARPEPAIVLERQVRSARPPVRWTVWPTDKRRRWLGELSGAVPGHQEGAAP